MLYLHLFFIGVLCQFILAPWVVYAIRDISMNFSANKTKVAIDIAINFTVTSRLGINQEIYIYLPYFTRQVTFGNKTDLDMDYGDVLLAPSTYFSGAWVEGDMNTQEFELNKTSAKGVPFSKSYLKLKMKSTAQVTDSKGAVYDGIIAGTAITLKIYKANGIGAWCGFPDSLSYNISDSSDQSISLPYRFETAYNDSKVVQYPIVIFPQLGNGCSASNNCNGHGACDYCREMCVCYEGFGGNNDIVTTGYVPPRDCSLRTCPPGKSIGSLPLSNNMSRQLAECSDRGSCDRTTGECNCFPPYSGSACEKMWCPNDCSGHGRCVPMSEFSNINNPNTVSLFNYGTAPDFDYDAWDHNVIYACECESSWEVGYMMGQWQRAEWFGPDCSLRRCPSGDNPFTYEYEEDCFKKNQHYGVNYATKNRTILEMYAFDISNVRLGEQGNYCHIDCSNRGNCDYTTGTCTCYDGSWGDNCAQIQQGGGANFVTTYTETDTQYDSNDNLY